MRLLYCLITFFMTILLSVSGEELLPSYKIIDLGLFGTDSSCADQVNEKGQVFGWFQENNSIYPFIWEENKDIAVIDYPNGNFSGSGKLNNKGQIVSLFSSQVGLNHIKKVIFWDPNYGFWELESSKDHIQLIDFNDNGQVLGFIREQGDNQIIIWDHGKKINLTALFQQEIPGKWNDFKAFSLNNKGHVAISAYRLPKNQQDKNKGSRLFIWKEESFSEIKICLDVNSNSYSVYSAYLDDDENVIINLGGNTNYFVNQSKLICIPCSGCNRILNGIPIAVDCLPSNLKRDRYQNYYFFEGIQIKKLFKEEMPYFNVTDYTYISDQNSKGYVVGSIDTLYGRHAFLAIPDK